MILTLHPQNLHSGGRKPPAVLLALPVIILLVCVPATVHAQALTWKAGQTDFPAYSDIGASDSGAKPNANETSPNKPKKDDRVILIEAAPADEPIPSLKYRVWPDPNAQVQADASVHVTRALVLNSQLSGNSDLDKQYLENEEQWLETPIGDLDVAPIEQFLANYRAVIRELQELPNMDGIGYKLSLEDRSGIEMISTLLPEYQELRGLARILRLATRVQIARGDFDGAIKSIQASYRLADFATKGNFLISQLVGFAIVGITNQSVLDMIEHQEGPNLYWALATLPRNLFSLRDGIDSESLLFRKFLPLGGDVDQQDISEEGWRNVLQNAVNELGRMDSLSNDGGDQERARWMTVAATALYEDWARRWLVDSGYSAEEVAEMSSAQATAVAWAKEGEQLRQSYFRWSYLPTNRISELGNRAEIEIKKLNGQYSPAAILGNMLLPAMRAAFEAEARGRQIHAMMITSEALRCHAFHHDGKLPETLADCSPLPAWDDPRSGKAFRYRRINDHEAEISREHSPNRDHNSIVRLRLVSPSK